MKTIGLKKGTVKILPHKDAWHFAFEKEKKLILSLNSKYIKGVEHVGSTAVSNMPAKPIIDIVVGVDSFYNAKKLTKNLARIGYEFALEPRMFQWLFIKQCSKMKILK